MIQPNAAIVLATENIRRWRRRLFPPTSLRTEHDVVFGEVLECSRLPVFKRCRAADPARHSLHRIILLYGAFVPRLSLSVAHLVADKKNQVFWPFVLHFPCSNCVVFCHWSADRRSKPERTIVVLRVSSASGFIFLVNSAVHVVCARQILSFCFAVFTARRIQYVTFSCNSLYAFVIISPRVVEYRARINLLTFYYTALHCVPTRVVKGADY